jgi:hypothetical protein
MKWKLPNKMKKIKYRIRMLKRAIRFFFQRMTRGWDDSELWSLDYSLARLISPRLQLFARNTKSFPGNMTEQEWSIILNKMCESFEYYGSEERWSGDEGADINKYQEGLDLFAKHYGHLWS